MLKINLKKNLISLSFYSAIALMGGCYGLADAKNSGEILAPIPQKLEAKPSNYRPIPYRYEESYRQKLAASTPTYPAIATASNPSQIALAKHLRRKKARFYGAWWCPHCHEQKELFGKKAFKFIRYVECSTPDNSRQQISICTQASIRAYPTWIIKGKTVEGVQSLQALANLSGYRGKRNFPSQ